jgi:RNA polymerase sigma-70 factor (ECF subfamily)
VPEPTDDHRELQPGSRQDFDALYRRSYGRILTTLVATLGNRAAAEDCAQETFVRAFRAWERWRPDAAPETWLHRIAINVAHSYRQRQRLREVGEVVRRLGPPREGRNPEDVAEENHVIHLVSQLPIKQSAVLVLRHYHGYSNREIAGILDVPERTVASRLARAKRRLQRLSDGLQDAVQDEPG